jgi:amino acid adenylation domain-containing protein
MQEQVEGFRLSPQQRALWNLRREAGHDTALCVAVIEGALVKARLQNALRRVVERHEILRTAFRHVAGLKLPLQVVRESVAPLWNESDLSGLGDREQGAAVELFIGEESSRGFDYEQAPNVRASLLTLCDDKHIFVLSFFSLCADSRTLTNVFEEVSRGYAASAARRDGEEPDEPLQYAQFAEWQNELLEGEDAQAGRERWPRRVGSDAPAQNFSFERSPRERGVFKLNSYVLKISPESLAGIDAIVEARGTTLAAFFLSCWQILVWRHTGQADPTVGLTLDGRRHAELEDAMGAFARTLPVGCRLEKGTSFDRLLAQADESVRDASDWQEYYSSDADADTVETGAGADSLSYVFEFRERPAAKLYAAGVTFSIDKLLAPTDRFKLKLSCERAGGGVSVELHYDEELFGEQDVEALAGQFESLTESAVERAKASVGELEMTCEAERRRLLVEWNDTSVEYPRDMCAHELFERQAALTPSSIAVEHEGRRLDYAQLNERANRLAHYLRRLKVGAETQVGIVMRRSPEMVVALLATLKAGGAYVPVEPTYPRERIAFMLEAARVVLTQKELLEQLPEAGRAVCLDEMLESLALESAENPVREAAPANLAYVLYTSGSTGQPKGVMVTHQGLVNYLSWGTKAYDAAEGQGAPVHSPLGFDLTVTSLLAPLLAGRPVVLSVEGHAIDGLVALLRATGDFGLVKLTPAHMQLLGRTASREEAASWARVYVIGGEALHWRDLAFWREHAPAARLINEYGPTETVVGCCVYEVGGGEREDGIVPIGRPIANTEIYLLDEQWRLAPLGVAGELCIGGDGVARGYFGRPDLTAERFVPHPFSDAPGARLYRSGDLARYRGNGVIEYLGRTDSQVKVRGYRIELGEIEASLKGQAGVHECVVTALEDAAGERRLVAYVVGEQGRRPEEGAMRAYLQTRLPDYMLPAMFVVLDQLPLTRNGKVDRRALPAPGQSDAVSKAYVAPRDLLELQLAHVWEELLGRRNVGARDDFFQLGGHSMLAARLVTRIDQLFGVQLPLNVLFHDATVEHLAALIRQKAEPQMQASTLVEIQRGEARPPLFLVHPSGGNVLCYAELARHLGADQPVYGFQSSEEADGGQHSHTSVEEMATLYAAALRVAQPIGPYRLGGWSMGGVVAFEMARQLEAAGEQVALLALLDAHAPRARGPRTLLDEVELLSDFAQDMGLTLDALTVSPEELLRRAPHELLPYVLELVRAAGILPPDIELRQLRRLYRIFKNNVTAARAYHPAAGDTRLTLFRADSSRVEGSKEEPSMGWEKLTSAVVEVYDVPGDHFRMVRAPHAEVLARKLRGCLDAAAHPAVEQSLVGA